eukprot:scaffold44371_cov62-Phaeocystis_antarctica.AAC.4
MVQALSAACRHLLVHLAVDHFEAAIEFRDALVAAQEVLAVARRVVLVLADGHRAAHVVEVRARPTRGLVDNGVLGERRRGAGLVVKDDLSGETIVELAPWTIRIRIRVRVRVRVRVRARARAAWLRLRQVRVRVSVRVRVRVRVKFRVELHGYGLRVVYLLERLTRIDVQELARVCISWEGVERGLELFWVVPAWNFLVALPVRRELRLVVKVMRLRLEHENERVVPAWYRYYKVRCRAYPSRSQRQGVPGRARAHQLEMSCCRKVYSCGSIDKYFR